MLRSDYPLMQCHVPEEQSPKKWQELGNVMVIQWSLITILGSFSSEDFPPKKHGNVTTQIMFHQFGMFLYQDLKKNFNSCNVFPACNNQIMLSVC